MAELKVCTDMRFKEQQDRKDYPKSQKRNENEDFQKMLKESIANIRLQSKNICPGYNK